MICTVCVQSVVTNNAIDDVITLCQDCNVEVEMKIFLERQIHIQTQILLHTILTLATKHLMIINKGNLYLQLNAF